MNDFLVTLAAKLDLGDGGGTTPGLPKVDTDDAIEKAAQYLIGVFIAVVILIMIINAFRMTVSRGNPEAFNKARSGFISALAGLLILILTEFIVGIVFNVLGGDYD